MLEDGKINFKQLILLMVLSRIILTITYLPALLEPPKNQDIWISEALFFPLQLLLSVPVYLLWKKFPDKTIIQYSQTIAGKAGKLVGILCILFIIHNTAISLAQFSLFLTTAIMPETPLLFFIVSLALVCAYAVRNGIEVISRTSELFLPIVILAIIMVSLLLIKDMNLKVLTPVMEKGIFPVLQGGFIYATRTPEVLGLAMLLPYLNERQKVKTIFIVSFALIAILFVLITIPILTVFGMEEASTRGFPFYGVIRQISVGDFLERIEIIHIGIWTLGNFIKVSLSYYLAVLGLGQLFNLKDYKPLALPAGTVIIPLSILVAPSIIELGEFLSYKIFNWYAMFFTFFIPSLLLLTAVIRKKGEKQK